jgi:glutamate-ammonia-ligase adenylyltransferase
VDARSYYARLTKAFLTAISAPTAEGRLYEVDMRLRPSGRQGPVATSLAAFQQYQRDEAWTWEHLALTRARRVAGSVALGDRLEAFRRVLLAEKAGGATVAQDVADMRARLAEAKPAHGLWDAKSGPGRLMDIELIAQFCALRTGHHARRVEAQLRAGAKAGVISPQAEKALLQAYRLCWVLQATGRLLADRISDIAALGPGGQKFILSSAGADSADTLAELLRADCAQADHAITATLASDAAMAGKDENADQP